MTMFTLTYDLRSPGQDYKKLYAELARVGAERVTESQWALVGDYTVVQLRDHFRQFLDSNDRLVVVQVDTWATWNAMIDLNKVQNKTTHSYR
jgi:hypothetical protein